MIDPLSLIDPPTRAAADRRQAYAPASLRLPAAPEAWAFSYLESLFLCDLIDEVHVTVERTDGTRVKFT
jgi:hypothetical protein